MATPRFAHVTQSLELGPDTRLLELEATEPLGFRGGQYVIIDSGLTLPNGKAAKRAYSLLCADDQQVRFRLAVKRIGLASSYLHGLEVGAEIKFSGPWGKMMPGAVGGETLVVATDTGITAALGLVLGAGFRPLLPATRFYWLRTDPRYFVPDQLVRELLPSGLGQVSIDVIPPIDHPERLPWVRQRIAGPPPTQAFIAGDGTVNYALLDDLQAAGVAATRDSVESFFNMPKKSA